ncbi:hypothetical protein [Pedobacter sp. UYP1]|uniref:hypothetical protein n=1 Tax=Pedobacter sp. UYP1 TaxID=1756396 RepID=UPI003397BEDA
MKKNKLSELTIIELNKQKSTLNGILIATGIVLLILCSILLYLITTNKKPALLTIIPCCLLLLLPGIIKLSQINTELKSRQAK